MTSCPGVGTQSAGRQHTCAWEQGHAFSGFKLKVADSVEGPSMAPGGWQPLSNMPGLGCRFSKSSITQVGG